MKNIKLYEESGFSEDEKTIPAKSGDVLVSEINEPHGVRAKSDMRVLVTIAPPI